MTKINEYCPNCKKLGIYVRVQIYDLDAEAETKIEQRRCANKCGYRGQRDITQTVISANFVSRQRQ